MLFAAPLATAAVALSGAATFTLPDDVTVDPSGAAKRTAEGLRLPVLGNGPGGTIRLGGGARLARDGRAVRLSSLELDGKQVTAKVDGINRLDVFTLSGRKVTDKPLATTVRARARGTQALGLGSLGGLFRVTAKRVAVELVGGQALVTFDPAFVDLLNAQAVEPSGGEGSTVAGDGVIQLPVTSGRLKAKGLEGRIGTNGGLAFNKNARALLLLEDYVLDTRRNMVIGRINDGAREPLFDAKFPKGSLQADAVVFGAATLTLTQATADALNTRLDATGFSAGQTLGTISVGAQVD